MMRVRSTCVLVMLFLPLLASAAQLPEARDQRPQLNLPERRMAVMTRARSFSHDRLGNNWVSHNVVEAPRDTKAAAVTLIRPNGTLRTYFASDILPPGEVLPGLAGQIFTISPMTTANHYVATVGYISRERFTRNAVVVFAIGADGEPRTIRTIVIRNAATAIGGPRDTIVVTAVDPLDRANFALATVLDINGNVQAELLAFGAPDVLEAGAVARTVRLAQSGADDFAVLDPQSELVQHFSIANAGQLPSLANAKPETTLRRPQAASPEIAFTADWAVSIRETGVTGPNVESRRMIDFRVDDATHSVTVVRNVLVAGAPRAVVSRHDGRDVEAWMADGPWNATLWQSDAVTGLAPRGVVMQQRVSLKGAIALESSERAPRAAQQQKSGCTSWMTGRQCAQITAAETPVDEVRRLRRLIALDGGGGEGCFQGEFDMCAHSVMECMDFWKECNLDDEGNTFWMNCTMDYCMIDTCQPWDCAQNSQKVCCPDGPTESTTTVHECHF